ncbi:hypothetical protein CDL15_Pgr009972 [Punica granatum]|uniref:Uncharacterized protein n=1 Tax=Punica granatum TaxID=22663 RepID=A0A218XP37_PUNGR|nr:hypothetical protein CDL15_Pgr009972 [Punica granatum]
MDVHAHACMHANGRSGCTSAARGSSDGSRRACGSWRVDVRSAGGSAQASVLEHQRASGRGSGRLGAGAGVRATVHPRARNGPEMTKMDLK